MYISHNRGHNNTIRDYSVTVMTHVIALAAGQSIQGTSEPITPVLYRLGSLHPRLDHIRLFCNIPHIKQRNHECEKVLN